MGSRRGAAPAETEQPRREGYRPAGSQRAGGARRAGLALIPIALMGALVAFLLARGPTGIFPGDFPPVEDLAVERTTLVPGEIKLSVRNGGPSPVTIAQVLVDEAYWEHSVSPSRTLGRLEAATITIPYPWVKGEPAEIQIVSSTGITFAHEIAVATQSPRVDPRLLLTFAALGLYIGVIPVGLGMAWMPFLRTLSARWLHFFIALTAGVLAFLGAETIAEALDESGELPTAIGGVGVVTAAALGSFLLILAGSRYMQRRAGAEARLVVAYTLAGGIGLHNLGEGLAVGAAYRLGEIALGAFLVIGFA
ncbi:MAG: ZIP family metal transporter, partial [Candidatus Methylomirabilales bacterium]